MYINVCTSITMTQIMTQNTENDFKYFLTTCMLFRTNAHSTSPPLPPIPPLPPLPPLPHPPTPGDSINVKKVICRLLFIVLSQEYLQEFPKEWWGIFELPKSTKKCLEFFSKIYFNVFLGLRGGGASPLKHAPAD